MSQRKYIFSFRKFVLLKEYDNNIDMYYYYVYVRVGLFTYIRVGYVDCSLYELMEEWE